MASSAPVFINQSARYASTEISSSFAPEAKILNGAMSPRPKRMPTDVLYGDWRDSSPVVHQAIRVLDHIQVLLIRAGETLESDPIASDDFINRLVPFLTELFCCRSIGEGFAVVSNALLCAVQNHATEKWERVQLDAVFQQVARLRREPFLRFEGAIEVVENLEAVDLIPEPRAFDYLADWLDDKSVC